MPNSKAGRIAIGVGVAVAILACVVGFIVFLVQSDRAERRSDREAEKTFATVVAEKQHGQQKVHRSTDPDEADVMEIRYEMTITNGSKKSTCIIELEADEDDPRTFWLDEVHRPQLGEDDEQDAKPGTPRDDPKKAWVKNPDKGWVEQHIRDNLRYYRCA